MSMKLYVIGLKDWVELREATEPPTKEATKSSRTVNGVKLRLSAVCWHGGRVLKVIKRQRFMAHTGLHCRSGQLVALPVSVARMVREIFQLPPGT